MNLVIHRAKEMAVKIIYEVTTVREFETEEQFEAWFDRHTIECLRAGYSQREMARMRQPGGLTITDGEQGVPHTKTTTEVKRFE